ncbi:prolipoprotein diacylglyceryl transferase [Aliiruegeria lutimaris]|uniref:Phosphatidylglycerol--prolipoprotein diacylglyceryl transferase n=1 Tax=Aliiruegeria lutimaris TaxID=571298 RepID=A0A1G9A331_9RHOB|nr:prolipoprotein diacylglyceryl transferase [Aliiruegeria lutimaris]SDK21762.1 Prolipoprotein diacylglyceryl transferase [Aliiruegeria lutimaris]
MQAVIPFPELSPEIFSISLFGMEFALRWYALAYIAGLLLGWRLVVALMKRPTLWPENRPPMQPQQVEDLLTWVILGVVIGGRLGFVLFYKPAHYLANPVEILAVWEGGMSFHGGLLGVVIATWLWTGKHAIARMSAADALAMAAPPGLFFGRLANFINGELWGRPSDVPWAMKFPTMCVDPGWQGCPIPGEWFYYGGELARHPSQLYEAALEGLVLGAVLLWLALRRGALKRPGIVTGSFFAGYGISRFIVEYFRQADAQFITPDNPIGFVIGQGTIGVTMGQLLSLPMILLGLALIAYARRRVPAPA